MTKSNDLINANFSFSLNEYRILMYAVSYVNPMNKEFPSIVNIDVKEFAKFFNIEVDGIYQDLKESITKRFFKREITLDVGNEEKKLCHWLDSLTYHNGKSTLKLEFSKNVIPLLTNLVQKFTSYHLEQIAGMKSIYAIRIYEFCILEINRQRTNYCEFIIELSMLKKRLDLNNKYEKRYDNFKTRVLKKSQSEINQHSDLTIDFEEIKYGRSVDKIKFIINRKNGAKPAKYNTEQIQQVNFSDEEKPIILPSEEEIAEAIYRNELKIKMMRYGVTEKVANQLLENYIVERIEYAIELLKKDYGACKIKNTAAYLVSAIKEDYQI
ncbi:replication initiation protein [Cysteiniphilum sp. 6C5]|uniref:replication initiation protein n=1 Tax=unclassified Cysteiniphilum TaxID=2610889 RepID=UPI003F83B9B8